MLKDQFCYAEGERDQYLLQLNALKVESNISTSCALVCTHSLTVPVVM